MKKKNYSVAIIITVILTTAILLLCFAGCDNGNDDDASATNGSTDISTGEAIPDTNTAGETYDSDISAIDGTCEENISTDGETTQMITENITEITGTTEETESPVTEAETTEEQNKKPPELDVIQVGKANVAPEGFAMAESARNDGGYSNYNINDGDRTTGFSSVRGQNTNTAKQYYLFIDLTKTYKVDNVVLCPLEGEEHAFPVDFDIMVSDDGVNYTLAGSAQGCNGNEADEFTVELGGVDAHFVKLVTKKLNVNGSDGAYFALSEFEIIADIDSSDNIVPNVNNIWLYKNPDTTQKLEAKRYRSLNVKEDAALSFYSDDYSVASVDSDGIITPMGFGETNVYISDGINMSVCHVKVIDDSKEEFRVTTFYHANFATPDVLEKCLDIIADTGIKFIEGTRAYDRAGNSISYYTIYLCEKRGMAYSVCDEINEDGLRKLKDEKLLAIIKKYENLAGFYGLYLRDEPHEEYTEYAQIFRKITDYNPHLTPHLNLLPPFNFGGTEEYFTEFAAVASGSQRMKYLSFDMYPFLWGTGFNGYIYGSMDMMRQAGLKYNASTGYYMQAMEITGAYRTMSDTDLMYDLALGVAYGFKNYKWFVALTPIGSGEEFTTGLVGPNFEPSVMCEGIKAVNERVVSVGKILAGCEAVEVYHTDNTVNCPRVPEDFAFTPIDNKSAIYTLYESTEDGRQYIVVTNKTFMTEREMEFRIQLADGITELFMCEDDTEYPVKIDDKNQIAFALDPGAFIIFALPKGYDATEDRHAPKSGNLALECGVHVSSSQAMFWEDGNIGTHFLTDGVIGTDGWLSARNDKNAYIIVDLGEVCDVSRILLYGSKAVKSGLLPTAYSVYISTDGREYTHMLTVENAEYTGESTVYNECSFDLTKTRYIKICVETGRYTGIGEIEVYR